MAIPIHRGLFAATLLWVGVGAHAASAATILKQDVTVVLARSMGGILLSDEVTAEGGLVEISCPDLTKNFCDPAALESGGSVDLEATSITLDVGGHAGPLDFTSLFDPFYGFVFQNLSDEPMAEIRAIALTTDIAGLPVGRVTANPSVPGLDPNTLNLGVNLVNFMVDPDESFTVDFLVTNPFIAYRETVLGETGFPTSPEQDAIGVGGLEAFAAFGGVPSLDGTRMNLDLVAGDGVLSAVAGVSQEPGELGVRDFEVRAHFDGWTLTTASGVDVAAIATFVAFEATPLASCGVSPLVGGAELVVEWDTESASAGLGAAASAIQSGAEFSLSCWVDRSDDSIRAAVEVDGFDRVTVGPVSQPLGTHGVVQVLTLALLNDPAGFSGSALHTELTHYEVRLRAGEKVPAAGGLARALLVCALIAGAARRRRPAA